uniref:Uncharacterized protein n=1 Tax=Candidatus Kentrum sp. SD TaxID=2126332 RepID=A0A450YCH5_9GAMM|nr:MAG: hypothetical protein BECKSD772F_GA0070984_103415 [Candidatus Kentron sp. SD]VFK39806.1 MAG: hypothetical protein BECKSD772E_GA0070983_100452 [Candidatus Kentron sp. SD]VFK78827.1 MAG: hypothetical protein BECKSD772D_GA0070982_102635 [Candidatus Kentron sp. SD]
MLGVEYRGCIYTHIRYEGENTTLGVEWNASSPCGSCCSVTKDSICLAKTKRYEGFPSYRYARRFSRYFGDG